MKRLITLTAAVLGIALFAAAVASASSQPAGAPATTPPEQSSAAPVAYEHYVACGLSQDAQAAHHCRKKRSKGAFFRSNLADVFYTVCVKFPTGKNLCAGRQQAVKGTLYVNKITSNIPGKHKVTWFVSGKRVGLFYFTVAG